MHKHVIVSILRTDNVERQEYNNKKNYDKSDKNNTKLEANKTKYDFSLQHVTSSI